MNPDNYYYFYANFSNNAAPFRTTSNQKRMKRRRVTFVSLHLIISAKLCLMIQSDYVQLTNRQVSLMEIHFRSSVGPD